MADFSFGETFHRYCLVCCGTTAERFGKARLANLLLVVNHLVPVLCSAGAVVFAADMWQYTVCVGREETFLVDLDNLAGGRRTGVWRVGRVISLPLYHPFRLGMNLVNFSYMLVVPVSYVAIYRFRKKQDTNVLGTLRRHLEKVPLPNKQITIIRLDF